eukprot:350713-Chlamydomonas_euryale.AAC.6
MHRPCMTTDMTHQRAGHSDGSHAVRHSACGHFDGAILGGTPQAATCTEPSCEALCVQPL